MENKNPVAELLNEARDLIAKDGIYPVLDYGWDGPETPSDEFVGIAMWTTDPPFEPELFAWNRPTPPPLPSARDEVIYKTAEDFFGTMDLALNALALTRYSLEHRRPAPILDDEELFWEHHASTAIWLNIASDRLREYIIMARFGKPSKEFRSDEKQQKSRAYALPFKMAGTGEGPYAAKAAKQLAEIAQKLGTQRQLRNELVHEITSRRGHHALQTLGDQRSEALRVPFTPKIFDTSREGLDANIAATESLSEMRESELLCALANLKEWYGLLVKAVSLTFEFEYWRRIGK